jgi:hypothetical protein
MWFNPTPSGRRERPHTFTATSCHRCELLLQLESNQTLQQLGSCAGGAHRELRLGLGRESPYGCHHHRHLREVQASESDTDLSPSGSWLSLDVLSPK